MGKAAVTMTMQNNLATKTMQNSPVTMKIVLRISTKTSNTMTTLTATVAMKIPIVALATLVLVIMGSVVTVLSMKLGLRDGSLFAR